MNTKKPTDFGSVAAAAQSNMLPLPTKVKPDVHARTIRSYDSDEMLLEAVELFGKPEFILINNDVYDAYWAEPRKRGIACVFRLLADYT